MSSKYQSMIDPRNVDGENFPYIIVNDGSITNIKQATAFIKEHKAVLERQLAKSGALLFRGFPVTSPETFDTFSASFDYPDFTYDESLSNAVRVNFTNRVFTANEAPKDVEIYLHHEMAQTPISPSKCFFFCLQSAERGGATPLCRSDKLLQALKQEAPKLANKFLQRGLKYTTIMPPTNDPGSGQGRSWRETLSVDSQCEAESKLAALGYVWQWLGDGSLQATTPVLPAIAKLTDGTETFYNQLIAAYLGWRGVRDDPSSAITFGDDSAIPISDLELIVELSMQFTTDLDWQDQDVAIVDNYRTMHGRRPYDGDRKRQVLVALAAKAPKT